MTEIRHEYDGIICFGGVDWWYHNRGHYDVQMMRHLAKHCPVLYVNSIGMRTPSPREGKMFLRRVGRKLASWRRGFVRIDRSFAVLSPPALPGRSGLSATRWLLARQIRNAARRHGIRRPLVWVACPTAAHIVDDLDPAGVVYQRTDRYECFQGVDAERIASFDRWLKARADLTIFCAETLLDREAEDCRRACLIDHGVDAERFADAAVRPAEWPQDVKQLPTPRIGFIGGIDRHTFDAELLLGVAARMPEATFVLVGASSLPRDWCTLDNVVQLGRRPFESVAGYMAACDVLIMPWQRSQWIEGCHPVKLKEYLAVGRPVVTTAFPELRRYEGLVAVANNAERFADRVRAALDDPGDASIRRARVTDQGWDARALTTLDTLAGLGCVGPGGEPTATPIEAVAGTPTKLGDWLEPAPEADPGPTLPSVAVGSNHDRLDLAACILLAGGLRPSPLVAATGLSVLDLWLTPEHRVLDHWLDRLDDLAADLRRIVPLRVIHNAVVPPPWPDQRGRGHLTIEQDPRSLRGPAGVVRDVCDYDPDEHVLVAESARYLDYPLKPMIDTHLARQADITVAVNPDGTPGGLYLVRCETLRLVNDAGFMDLKEQWLRRAVESGYQVVVHRTENAAWPLRSREQLIRAARVANGVNRGTLRVVCSGGLIGPDAVVEDSIVMPGATVSAMATVVRSVLCPGTYVQPRSEIVDSVIYAGDELGVSDAPGA